MKSILMSIQPQWCAKILNREKTIELRKRFPLDYVGWVYMYCTKSVKDELVDYRGAAIYNNFHLMPKGLKLTTDDYRPRLNGKVVARFWCDGVTKLKCGRWVDQDKFNYYGYKYEWKEMLDKSLLNEKQLIDYGEGKPLYAIHITKLEIFDTPKELVEFNVWRKKTIYSGMDCPPYVDDIKVPLTRAPHNWCWVE